MDALKEKFFRELPAPANAKLTNFWTPTETATLVETTKSSPTDSAFALPDTPLTAVVSALCLAELVNSPSREDVPSAPSTPSTNLRSTDVDALTVSTRTTSECVPRWS